MALIVPENAGSVTLDKFVMPSLGNVAGDVRQATAGSGVTKVSGGGGDRDASDGHALIYGYNAIKHPLNQSTTCRTVAHSFIKLILATDCFSYFSYVCFTSYDVIFFSNQHILILVSFSKILECPPQTYGIACSMACGKCGNGSTCDPVTGQCTSGCEHGWTGEKCDRRA